jgi:hypothetical protein
MTPRSDGYIPPCIPTRAYRARLGPRDQARRLPAAGPPRVRLFTRHGPAIAVTAMQLRTRSFTLDGEARVCGPDGIAIFDALHRRGRAPPLGDRKKRLARLLA